MRILGIQVNGFGWFADVGFGPFERPVTLILGPNEAGKSTLLEFIRRVFFGFPDGRSSSNPYPPLAGGRHGGSVTIVSDASETVTVERFQGRSGGAVTLTGPSAGPRPESELSRLMGHHSRDVFQNVFTFTLDELYSDKLLSDHSVNAQIYAVGMGATKLPDVLSALNSDKRRFFSKRGENHEIVKAYKELCKIDSEIEKVSNNAAEYSDRTIQLKEVEGELERLSELRREHQSELGHQKQLERAWDDWNDLNQAEGQLAELPPIDNFPANGVGRLETLEERVRTAQEEYASANATVEEARAKAEAAVEHETILNHSTDIRKLDLGSKSFGDAVRDLPKHDAELEDHERSLAGTLSDMGADWDEARLENFDLSMAVREDISQFQQHLQEAEQKLGQSESTLTQYETLLEEAADVVSRAKREHEDAVKAASGKNGRRMLPAICIGAGIALLAVGWVLGGNAFPIGVIAGILLVCIAAYLFVSDPPSTNTETEIARLSREFDRANELARQRQNRVRNCRRAVEEAERSLASIQREWQQWLADRNLRETFLPETVVELRGKVELGRNQLRSLRSHRERIDAIQKDIDGYIELVEPLAKDVGVPFDGSDSNTVAAAADGLVGMYASVERRVRERTDARDALKKAEHKLKQRASDLREAEVDMKGLLQSGGAADVEDFRTRADIVHLRTELEDKRRGALGGLQRLSGPGEPLETLKKQLGGTDIQAIRDAERSIEEKIESAEAKIRERSTDRGSIQSNLKSLTSEEESSRLRAERHRWLEEMSGHARQWAVRTIAENLLKVAQAKFERERQPDVVRHAQSFFKGITDGRYQTVFSPLDKPEIWVTDSAKVSKQPFQLSRGTREQLFLSLRFGLIRELGQRSERLPVILDEALVNFDPERGLRAACAFMELSRTNQVLVFTCHPAIVELFQNAAAKSGVQEPEVVPIG